MEQFPSAAHLCFWAEVVLGNNENAGKRKLGKTSKGNEKLWSVLVKTARAVAHTKDTYLSAQYHRIVAQRGANRAAVAVAHSILTIVHYLLKRKETYSDLGVTYYEERKKEAIVKQSIKKLEALGVVVVFCLFC